MQATAPRILDEAAHWLARSHASDFSAAEQAALARWRGRSAQHEQIWLRAQQLQQQFHSVPGLVGQAVLNRPRASGPRRQMLRTLALVLGTPALGWLAYRQIPWQEQAGDYQTATGERRSIQLADGSQVVLNTASAISVRIDATARRITQHTGEISIETAHGPAYANRPFIVQTQHGQMQALGTRFTVRKRAQDTSVSVFEGAVRVTPAQGTASPIVRAGEQLRFNAQETQAIASLAPQSDAWTQGLLYAENLRLQDFLAELQRYRPGLVRCDPEIADLRVSGVYQLRDTDSILALLTQSLPVRIEERTRYWVTIKRR